MHNPDDMSTTTSLFDHLRASRVTGRFFTPDGRLVDVRGGAEGDPPADPPPVDPPADPPADPPPDDAALIAEIAAEAKALGITPGQLKGRLAASKTWETRAKKADADLEAARIKGLSDQERAVEERVAAERVTVTAEVTKGFGTKLAAAEIKAAGIPAELVEDLDLTKFLTDAGEVDADKVSALAAKHKALIKPGVGSADGGPQGAPPAQGDLAAQLAEANAKGDVASVLRLNGQLLAQQAIKQ